MPGITVSVDIPAAPAEVWADLSALDTHTEWMTDAHNVEYLSDRRQGAGPRIAVVTRLGPLRTTDVMEFTAWEEPVRMAVAHRGLFTGSGEFLLEAGGSGTCFTWSEEIRFPWFFGGPLGAWLARPVLRWVWRRNLSRLQARFTAR